LPMALLGSSLRKATSEGTLYPVRF